MHRLLIQNLRYYWRTNLAVVAGVATSVAVLSGALLVGQSVRASLRDLLFQRLGATQFVVAADRFFRDELASTFASSPGTEGAIDSCPIISLQGVVTREKTGQRAYRVNVYGVDERFWKFHGRDGDSPSLSGRDALVGTPLARRLGIESGDGLLLRVETQKGIPRESLYGRRENVGRTIRLTCRDILPAGRLGEFALRPGQGDVENVFVPLSRLQQDLGQVARANVILLAPSSPATGLGRLRQILRETFSVEDVGVSLRPLPAQDGVSVESQRILLDESIAQAAFGAAAESGLRPSGVFTYLANSIRSAGREIPYSVITAADLGEGAFGQVQPVSEGRPQSSQADVRPPIWLSEWASRDLGATAGAPVEVDYYQWQEKGSLVTRSATFRFAGVVPSGRGVDSSLAPAFPGITEAGSIREWDPPFPVDLRRIRPQDEEFWNRYKAAPKAFVSLRAGQQLWQSRFGRLSAVRLMRPGREPNDPASRVSDQGALVQIVAAGIRKRLDPEQAGFTLSAVRQRGIDAAAGSTDFGEYFTYFSFFLIAASVLLFGLFFRLGVEQRVREVGTLQALGFPQTSVRGMFLIEGAILSVVGSMVGLMGAVLYGGMLVFGLRTWWVGAVGTRQLQLHVSWGPLALGAGAGCLVSLLVIAWTLRGLHRNSTRALLSGVLESRTVQRARTRGLRVTCGAAFLSAAAVSLASTLGTISDVEGFFGTGLLLLVAMLSLAAIYLRGEHPKPISGHGWRALARLAVRNGMHRPGRSLLSIALVGSATFVVVSVEAFRKDPRSVELGPRSGSGGFPLIARAALPIVHDPNTPQGREALGIPASEVPELARIRFVPFRERPGDDASCLNLYAPQEPTLLGASHAFIESGRFSFQNSLASSPDQVRNPWTLLESSQPDGAIPVIGDATTIQYILHLSVGREMAVGGGDGRPVRLRLVGALRDSILQGELVMSEANFLRAFPEQEGFRFFLLEAGSAAAEALIQPLEDRLVDWGVSVELSRNALAAYHRVENTYLSTFQALGALGLVLGTIGLAAVLLRNVLERRNELALLCAVGYRERTLALIIVVEHVLLMIWGLACGTACALVSVLPVLHARGGELPLTNLGVMLVGVLMVGAISSGIAVVAAFRSPLLTALRSE
jgi:putative ABC transport system permease protein